MVNFEKVNPKQSFPELEEAILEFWKANNIFKKSIENRCDCEEYNFYDGPPFATGTPHYGHILAGTIKDVVPRYQTMIGKKVERRFGWDTHGLPIENIVEKKLNISGKDDIEKKIGVFKFNETCRENVFGYVDEWRQTVERMGRWVDMDNDYKTMDTDFMESVWWVFKTIYDKGLIYEGNRIVPYCPRCTTPLSNFEVNQGYEDKQDKSVTVKFKVKDSEKKYILAWTTTPWTLVANLGLAVGEDIEYAELMDKTNSEIYILAKDRIGDYYKDQEDYEILRIYKGKCLEGISYEPLFPDFVAQKDLSEFGKDFYLGKNAYKVVTGHHVTTESGTGIVHIAPAYGEDDNIIGKEKDLGFVAHISDTGKTENLLEDNDIYVFEFNDLVIEKLKKSGELVKISTINHSYPHCWRCHTPLIYRAISAWYVDVTAIKEHMIKNNQKITWVPGDIRNGRMGKWLEGAKDWNISRNRYWGSAIPVWQNEDKTEEVCIGSIKELYELNKDFGQIEEKDGKYFYKDTGKEIDLHKHFVDEILVKNPKTGNTLRRIPEVLDCWFESGSMPYASKHYMGQELEKSGEYLVSKDGTFKFPADFIAEGLDQTRGWFYTLIILGTALFDETPFKNCIVNGIVLAEDGKKMSKSLQNYPAPELIFDKYGADAMRFYLLNSPVVEAQDFRFSETGVEEVVKKVILPLWNTYYFFTTYANIDNFEPKGNLNSENILDKWLISELNELTLEVRTAFDNYELNQATRPILKFMDNLTNWYIRRSRKRFWKSENDSDKLNAYETLYFALVELTKILAPFVPFVSEYIYKNLTKKESVHLEDFPSYNKNLIDLKLNENTDKIQKIINLGLAWRANQKIRVRQPLQSITITEVFDDYYNEIIKEELNVKSVLVVDGSSLAKKICKPNGRNIGPKFGANVKFIMSEAKSGNFEELTNGNVKVGEFELEAGDFELVYEASNSSAKIESGFGMVISMDEKITDELKQEGFARDLVRHIQESRKEADYNVEDRIFVKIESLELAETIKNFTNYIESETLSKITNDLENSDLEKNISVEGIEVKICLKK
ncbi:isoleucine--tRNA ligase [Candidatus Gracilibacteria bacterium HOT-871]|nr:isoleucine--tRNA ligase [Candidatus Gracilibacteria bacterium HOT-871]